MRQLGSVVVHDLNNAIFALLGRVQLLKRKTTDPAIAQSIAEILETVRLLESLVGSLHAACQRDEAPLSLLNAKDTVETALREGMLRMAEDDGGTESELGVSNTLAAIPANAVFEGNSSELASAVQQLMRLHRRRTDRPLQIAASTAENGASPRIVISISDAAGEWRHPCTPPSILKGSCDLETLPIAAAQRAVRDMGGKVTIEPIAGGLESRIEIPVAIDGASAHDGRSSACLHDSARTCETDCATACTETRRPRHILVADDDPAVRAILVAALESVGDEVDTIAQPSALLGHPQLDLFDVVILDAGGGGLEALRRLRARGSALPVLVASGESLDEKAIANGHAATRVMMKPIPLDQLDRTLTALAAKRP